MALRHMPVHPNLDQLKRQAKELMQGVRAGDSAALAEFQASFPRSLPPDQVRLVDAQRALARSYGIASWPRLVTACRLIDAIWADDRATVRDLILRHPKLLTEDARGVKGNWGPPMSYAANVGRSELVTMLREMGADDVQYAFGRACLRGKLETARLLHSMGAIVGRGAAIGPCESLNGPGLALMMELGGEFCDDQGDPRPLIGMILETYSRNPAGKHQCLEIAAQSGVELPDTPPMALHRGRIDLLEKHLARDPDLLSRTFSHEEIYPLAMGCHEDTTLALHGTPIAGGTLLHLAVDFDEIEIAQWLLAKGMDVNAKAAVDEDGFGGHTALFGCVVSQPYRANCRKDDTFARLLLDQGADTSVVASLRKTLRFVDDETEHIYRNVTARQWGEQFHDQDWVNPSVMALLT